MLHEQNNRLVDNASNGHLPEGSTLSLGDCFVHGGAPMPYTYYRIVDWDKHFENNRSRQLQKLDWVPVPNRHDGDGYTELLDHPDGAAHLGAWLAIVQVASKCHPRGTLVREGDRPHNPASISRITRVPAEVIEAAIKRLVEIGWMEVISASTGSKTDDCHDPAPERHDPAPGCDLVTKEGKGKEGKGKEGKGKEGKGKEGKGKLPTYRAGRATAEVEVPATLNTPEFLSSWEDWVSDRRERGKPVTKRAAETHLKELEKLENVDDAIACIEIAINRGWQGIKAEWFHNSKGTGRSGKAAGGGESAEPAHRAAKRERECDEPDRPVPEW